MRVKRLKPYLKRFDAVRDAQGTTLAAGLMDVGGAALIMTIAYLMSRGIPFERSSFDWSGHGMHNFALDVADHINYTPWGTRIASAFDGGDPEAILREFASEYGYDKIGPGFPCSDGLYVVVYAPGNDPPRFYASDGVDGVHITRKDYDILEIEGNQYWLWSEYGEVTEWYLQFPITGLAISATDGEDTVPVMFGTAFFGEVPCRSVRTSVKLTSPEGTRVIVGIEVFYL